MRAMVLGATGHIGAHIVRALLASGHEVRAAYRRDRYLTVLEGLKIARVRVDLEAPETLREAAAGCDWVFHAAGYYPPFGADARAAIARGVESVRRTLEALRAAGVSRIVFTSSAAVVRHPPGRDATEDDIEEWPPTEPGTPRSVRGGDGSAAGGGSPRPSAGRTVYAQVKIAMDHEAGRAAEGGLPVVLVNPSVCLGEYDAHLFSGLIILAYAKWRMPWYLDHRLNAVYTGDVGVGHVRAAERGRIGQRYLLAGETWHTRDLARLIAEETGVAAPRWRLPLGAAEAASRVSHLFAAITRTRPLIPQDAVHSARTDQLLDGGKARRELGMPQTPIREAVRRAVGWFRQRGYC